MGFAVLGQCLGQGARVDVGSRLRERERESKREWGAVSGRRKTCERGGQDTQAR
jgi:hypothetical protein